MDSLWFIKWSEIMLSYNPTTGWIEMLYFCSIASLLYKFWHFKVVKDKHINTVLTVLKINSLLNSSSKKINLL